MQKTKKIFSALLAIVMLISVFTFTTSAGAPAPTGTAKVSIAYEVVNANGDVVTTVAPGETVKVNVYANAASATDTLREFKMSIFYDSAVFTCDKNSLKWEGLAGWVSTAGSTFEPCYTAGNSYYDAIVKKATTEELAYGWNAMAYCVGVASGDEDYLVQENADNVMWSVEFKVADNVAPGTPANIGCYNMAHYVSSTKSYCYIKTPSIGSRVKSGSVMMPATQALTVKAAVEPSIVNPLRDGQIRFHKNGTAYAGSFDVRALAVIKGDDFTATFGDIATAKTMISEIGFVFAQGANVTAPSMDAVKALVENGTEAAGYAKKTVKYISTSVDEGNYVFSCIATDIPDAEKNNSLVAVGYIAYTVDGETVYAYYPAAQTISFAGLFNTHYADAFGA